jgi:hypothetical protein
MAEGRLFGIQSPWWMFEDVKVMAAAIALEGAQAPGAFPAKLCGAKPR